jgi:pimeloyl-ACP methyl ester carboxylesterase
VLLDQRGTGLSTPLTAQTLPREPEAAAEHLTHFRADAIVRDAEHVRTTLLGDEPWSVLGQSFGGFATLTYLSFAPDGVREAFVTGGLPSLHRPAIEVYRATNARLDAKIAAYLGRYPDDEERWRAVLDHVGRTEITTPRGRVLTPRSVRLAGGELGMSTGPEQLHYLVEGAFTPDGELSATFVEQLERRISFALAPLYAILHEPIYAQGEASAWAAQRAAGERDAEPLLWGEMVFPWMFEEDPALQPLREAAEILAAKDDWPALYDTEQLEKNRIPVVAAVYLEDLYVESAFSLETAEVAGSLRVWTTNEFDHDGIHAGDVLDRLIARQRGEA